MSASFDWKHFLAKAVHCNSKNEVMYKKNHMDNFGDLDHYFLPEPSGPFLSIRSKCAIPHGIF